MTQDEAIDILKLGRNVFLTGPAGSGKTYLLNRYIEYLKKHNVPVAITASTGIAATHMEGRTIHSWAAIKISRHLTKKELDQLFYTPEIRARITHARVLIIDEVSMLDEARLDLVDEVCRKLRDNPFSFGGLQLIVCGDFFQLPPVPSRGEPPPKFAFMSSAWQGADIITCYLEKQYRQNDLRFFEILNAIRNNEAAEPARAILMERHQKSIDGIKKPTKLYAHNSRVNAINDFELGQIDEEEHKFEMYSEGNLELVTELKRSCLAPSELTLKKGTFVMFVKNNFNNGYANGTLGTVIGFDEDSGFPIIKKRDKAEIVAGPASWVIEESDVVIARISQIPLRLAWAITIHKSQGMSLDCAEIDLGNAFLEGMGYVALSRVRTLTGIKLMGINEVALKVNPEIVEFDKKLREMSKAACAQFHALEVEKKKEAQGAFIQHNSIGT